LQLLTIHLELFLILSQIILKLTTGHCPKMPLIFTIQFSSTPGKFALNVKLEYFNTASAKQIAKLLLLLEKFNARTKVIVNWYYKPEDKDMLASGIRFSKLIPIEFNFIEF